MYFETAVDQLESEFDITQATAVAAVNSALDRMLATSEYGTYYKTLGNTTADTSTYTLGEGIVALRRLRVDFTDGTKIYEGSSNRFMWDLDVGAAAYSDSTYGLFAIIADADDTGTTASVRLYPTPSESGKAIMAEYAGLPADLTYSSSTALPIPEDQHEALLAGARAELMRQEEGVADPNEAAQFETGIAALRKRANARGTGSGAHRVAVWGWDF